MSGLPTESYLLHIEDLQAYLGQVGRARVSMNAAEDLMLKMASRFEGENNRAARKRLARAHKAMIKARKAWNRVEASRGNLW